MPKKENEKQLDLFEFDPKEKELRLEEINKIKNIEKEARAMQRKEIEVKRRKEQKKIRLEQEKKNRVIDEENFNACIKQAKEYLSWDDSLGYQYKDEIDYLMKIENSYSQKISEQSGIRIYSFKWNLPTINVLFEFTKNDLKFSGEDNLSSVISCYESMLEYSDKLFNPEKDLYDYFPFYIKMKKGKKEPKWYGALYTDFKYDFNDQKINFTRHQNIITFEWQIPEDFESITFDGDQELCDRIKYSTM